MPKQAINYQNTIIYKIVCKDLNIKDIYIGHTTNFTNRKKNHKDRCNNKNDKCYNFKIYKTIREYGNWENWDMIEIEKISCNDSNEARARERFNYELYNANLNVDYPNRTQKEYRDMNTEKIKIKNHNKYIENREAELLKKKERITCCCGETYTRSNKNKHIVQNEIHLKYLENINII